MPGFFVKRAFVNLSRHLRFLNRRKLGKETGHFQESGRQGRGKQRLGGKGEGGKNTHSRRVSETEPLIGVAYFPCCVAY